ncbi:hypothetical protein B6N31_15825 [Dickeya fangzhongdai]|uniref:hypothetical protein n=1 Tax=Dickeya fangzhongdai TaxID=1778540 RepID=UPI000EAC1AEF|nr:hypothetical protein B6N31_15825 [Dickeya fangzhongdai]
MTTQAVPGTSISCFLLTALLPVMISERQFTFSQPPILPASPAPTTQATCLTVCCFLFSRLGQTSSNPALMLFIGTVARQQQLRLLIKNRQRFREFIYCCIAHNIRKHIHLIKIFLLVKNNKTIIRIYFRHN